MLRSLSVLLLLAVAAAAGAQEAPTVYQQQKSSTAFHIDGVTRQEWTDEVTFVDTSRRLYRFKPRVEFSAKWLQLGLGGDFVYGSDHNTDPPEGATTLALLRDNYKSRDARLDLAWVRLSPVRAVSAQGGRFPMPVRFTEMIWDRDLRVQGGAATIDFGSIGPLQRLAVTGVFGRGSHILPDDGAFKLKDRDTVWVGSATATFSAGAKDRIELIGSFVKFEDLQFVDTRVRRQNTRVAGALVLPYEVVDLVARYHGEGRVSTTLVADYSWNRAVAENKKGLWLAMVLGSTITARGSLEYTYASVDKDATLAAYTTDDFIWGTGWSGHRLDLGVRMSDRASSHVVGQLQKFKDSPIQADRDTYLNRLRLEVRVHY
jgi:putative porin